MEIREIECKTALSKSGLPGLDYALNPYRGCSHACAYCYAPAILRESRKWGGFLDVKANIPEILAKEVRRFKSGSVGVVGVGTVTDPYQDAEREYRLTRKCIEALLVRDFPVCIQTKSALVLRDIDIIKKFGRKEVGFTITSIDDSETAKYEGGSRFGEKLDAITKLRENGIDSWVFLGPVLPRITDRNGSLKTLVESVKKAGAAYIITDRLRLKPGTLENIDIFLQKEHPEMLELYDSLFRRGGARQYYDALFRELERLCMENGIPLKKAFGGGPE